MCLPMLPFGGASGNVVDPDVSAGLEVADSDLGVIEDDAEEALVQKSRKRDSRCKRANLGKLFNAIIKNFPNKFFQNWLIPLLCVHG
eukprot:TRINITY_DN8115_c0_g1_i1.p2 TRINITY_DN8115_c0_g1~~TRINITY_DN8115_c0_g1_i1.p2  ORF type:complete len:87 (+),score=8.78 TRINITY_DN8115_c0_g1_i1:257-517(+)